ncbi:hypothetical protein HanIR_Chr02g0072171 [Helianthus annuus]|nr:hypothetical protein HanIR_Chr02g0072171 [Helianthus annuus]
MGWAEGKGRKLRGKRSHLWEMGSKRWRRGEGGSGWWRWGGRRARRGKGEVVARRGDGGGGGDGDVGGGDGDGGGWRVEYFL